MLSTTARLATPPPFRLEVQFHFLQIACPSESKILDESQQASVRAAVNVLLDNVNNGRMPECLQLDSRALLWPIAEGSKESPIRMDGIVSLADLTSCVNTSLCAKNTYQYDVWSTSNHYAVAKIHISVLAEISRLVHIIEPGAWYLSHTTLATTPNTPEMILARNESDSCTLALLGEENVLHAKMCLLQHQQEQANKLK